MAFPTVNGTPSLTASSTTNATTFAAGLPASIAAGELLLLVVSADGNPTLTINSGGWYKIGQASNSTVVTGAIFWKVATGSEGATVTVNSTASEQYSSISYRIGSGYDITASTSNGSSTNSDPPNHVPPDNTQDYLWIASRSGDSTVVATVAPTSFGSLQSRAAGGTGGASTDTATYSFNAASLNPGTFTSATEQWVCWTIAVSPQIDRVLDVIGGGMVDMSRSLV